MLDRNSERVVQTLLDSLDFLLCRRRDISGFKNFLDSRGVCNAGDGGGDGGGVGVGDGADGAGGDCGEPQASFAGATKLNWSAETGVLDPAS